MSVSTNAPSVYGGTGRGSSRGRGRGRGSGRGRGGNGSIRSRSSIASRDDTRNNNENDEQNERDRNEFIASFNLNISSTSSPVLVRNGITKLGDNCYSARMIREYFQNSNPHNINLQIKQIWKVSLITALVIFFVTVFLHKIY